VPFVVPLIYERSALIVGELIKMLEVVAFAGD
jgi:hypothetical protein